MKSKKTKSRRSGSGNRYQAQAILALFDNQANAVSWPQLVAAADAQSPKDITQLRQMLRGLVRNGDLQRDLSGDYIRPGQTEALQGTVVAAGRRLQIQGETAALSSRLTLRPGDQVRYSHQGDEISVHEITAHSDAPVTGILHWQNAEPYVESLGLLKSKVWLTEKPAMGDDGDTVTVRITGRDGRALTGEVIDVITSDHVLEQAVTSAIAAHHIPWEWPEEVTAAAAKLPKSVDPERFAQRVDLTAMPLVTIDGETAKDFDDAVYAETVKGQGWRLVVAIADVAHYVKLGSELDLEAQHRGTSAYFPERVVPMFPEVLSNGLCSLRPLTPRLSLVCDMQISRAGQVTEHTFYEAVIFSHARLTYEQVHAYLQDGQSLPVEAPHGKAVAGSIKQLQRVYAALRQAREKRGALDFPTHEGALTLRNGRVHSIAPVARLQTHQLIEEAMVAANVCAAEFLEQHHTPGLYRVHAPPEADKLEELRQVLAFVGVRLPPGDARPQTLQKALEQLPEHANQWLYGQLALRTMQQAVYTPDNQGHFGLALERYMHFTSPIRRYPDLAVHRAIKGVLAQQQNRKPAQAHTPDQLAWLGEQCSNYERRAESAGWMVDAWLKCDYLRNRVGDTLPGIVAAVTEFGLFVELQGCFIQGLLHISNLGQDYFTFQARSQTLVGERNGRRFALGDELTVSIASIEATQGKIDLQLAEPDGQSPSKSRRRRKRA